MHILLRGTWQSVNIGDVAHSPGIINLFSKAFPDADFTLWTYDHKITDAVRKMMLDRFPSLRIVTGAAEPGNAELIDAFGRADLLIHASAASFSARREVKAFVDLTGKPFGVFGISFNPGARTDYGLPVINNDDDTEEQIELLKKAAFVFFRDSKSLARARSLGLDAEYVGLVNDAAFAFDITNREKAEITMRKYGLSKGKFVCCIPRWRFTPYWKIVKGRAVNEDRERRNLETVEKDNAVLRRTIGKIVDETDLDVFICPEDETQIRLGREILWDKLPENIKERVHLKKEFWLPDEALGVYMNSVGLFGLEMHSPILCVSHGVPAIVGRFREQTTKGFMWQDIGLADWLFDFDVASDRDNYPETCLEMIRNHEESVEKTHKALKIVQENYQNAEIIIKKSLSERGII